MTSFYHITMSYGNKGDVFVGEFFGSHEWRDEELWEQFHMFVQGHFD